MSVVAVKKYPDKIIIAADSQVSWGKNKTDSEKLGQNGKLFKVNGLIVGSAGSTAELSLFRNFCLNHKPKGMRVDDMLSFFVEFATWAKTLNPSFILENHYLIIIKNKIFRCLGYDIEEVNRFFSIGSGMFLALGALEMNADPKNAVDVAKKFDLYCSGKVIIFTVKLKR